MPKFNQRLRELRNERNLSQQQLADILGISKSSINMYERGEREPGIELLLKLSTIFNASVDYLLGKSNDRIDDDLLDLANEIDDDLLQKYGNLYEAIIHQAQRNKVKRQNMSASASNFTPASDYVTFPVMGEIAAGYDHLAVTNDSEIKVHIPIPSLKGRPQSDYFVLQVKGNSMFPEYHDGDFVLILKQDTMEYSGQVGAVIYNDDHATLKKIEYAPGEDWMKLVPINPNHPTEEIKGESLEHCKVLGIPKLLIRDIKK